MSWGNSKDIACKVSYCGNVTKSKVTVTFPFTGGNSHVASEKEPLPLLKLTTCENILHRRRASRRAASWSHQASANGHIKPLLHKCLRGGKDGSKTDLGFLTHKVWVYCIKATVLQVQHPLTLLYWLISWNFSPLNHSRDVNMSIYSIYSAQNCINLPKLYI